MIATAKAVAVVWLPAALAVVSAATAFAPAPPDPGSAHATRTLLIPVDGVDRGQLRDNFAEMRGAKRRHDALDIRAPRGTPMRAVDDGRVAKLFRSPAGGISVYDIPAGARAGVVEGNGGEPVPEPY
jgi:murein DD-endopeptidase MepM/ murein hydrolase activator NlpD